MNDAERLAREKARWERDVLRPYLEKNPERSEVLAAATASGIPLDTVYLPGSGAGEYLAKLGLPAEYPYTRGIVPNMYRSQLWVMGMYSGFGSAEDANLRYRYLLEQGQTGFSIALDLPTQMGYDSDHPLARGEVGKVGVALDSLDDMERLFQGIALEKVRQIRTTANAIGPVMAALYIAYLEKMGQDPGSIRMFFQNDVLKEYSARGTYIVPPRSGLKLAGDLIEYGAKHLPGWVTLSICGYHFRDSGATAVQELAFSFADGIAYLDEVRARGADIDSFAPTLFTLLSSSVDLLEEVAKFRAARRLWARLLRDRYGAQRPESLTYRIFAYTLGGALTARQPLNNIVRVTIETLAAALGGVQTLATSAYDEALSIPSEQAVTVALRTQQIVALEAGVTATADPFGGAYALEALTDEIERQVEAYLEKIAAHGGAVVCCEQGFFQKELAEAAYRHQRDVESGRRALVGENRYVTDDQVDIPIFSVDEQPEVRQRARLQDVRSRRNRHAVETSLADLEAALRRGENSIPPTVAAVKVYATVGEICDVYRKVYGSYRDPAFF